MTSPLDQFLSRKGWTLRNGELDALIRAVQAHEVLREAKLEKRPLNRIVDGIGQAFGVSPDLIMAPPGSPGARRQYIADARHCLCHVLNTKYGWPAKQIADAIDRHIDSAEWSVSVAAKKLGTNKDFTKKYRMALRLLK